MSEKQIKNILILSLYYYNSSDPGSNRMHSFATEFLSRGFSVDVLSLFSRDLDEYENGIHVIAFGSASASDKSPKGRLKRDLFFSDKAKSWLKKNNPHYDCVVLTDPDTIPCYFLSKYCARKHWKIVYDVRDVWPEVAIEMGSMKPHGLLAGGFRGITKSLCRSADLITTVSVGKIKTLSKKSPKSISKIHLLSNGFDDEILNPFECSLVSELNKKVPLFASGNIVYAGNVGKAQGLDCILELAKSCLDQKNCHFFIIGTGSDKERLVQKAKDMSLSNLLFCEPIPKSLMPVLYSRADSVIVALKNGSMKDSIPSKLYEVLAFGIPTFLIASGDAVSLLQETKIGLAVDPDLPKPDLVQSFSIFLSKLSSYQNQKDRCAELIKNNYSRSVLAKQFVTLVTEQFSLDQ